MSLRIDDLDKSYEAGTHALAGVTLEVAEGELLAIVGPSGSGKSTLLRCVAGLEVPDRGTVTVAGRDVSGLRPGERDVAMIFQDLALYPHLSVRQNIAFPILARKVERTIVAEKVEVIARTLGLETLLDRRPQDLSGGERRRVAIARAVIREPQLFLMDEPLSNLDAQLKLKVQEELRDIQTRLGVATIYVTHDQAEAMALGEKVAVMRHGVIVQVGTAVELYDSPKSEWVALFFGRFPMNVLPGSFVGASGVARAGIRPEDIHLTHDGDGRIHGHIKDLQILGPDTLVLIASGDETLRAVVPRSFAGAPGDRVGLSFKDERMHRFDEQGMRV